MLSNRPKSSQAVLLAPPRADAATTKRETMEEQRSSSTNNERGDAPAAEEGDLHDSADWTIYGMGWSQREEEDRGFRLALVPSSRSTRIACLSSSGGRVRKAVGTGVGRGQDAQALQRKAGKDPNDSSALCRVASSTLIPQRKSSGRLIKQQEGIS